MVDFAGSRPMEIFSFCGPAIRWLEPSTFDLYYVAPHIEMQRPELAEVLTEYRLRNLEDFDDVFPRLFPFYTITRKRVSLKIITLKTQQMMLNSLIVQRTFSVAVVVSAAAW